MHADRLAHATASGTRDLIVRLAREKVLPRMAKRLRCYFGAHRWQPRQYEDGRPYKECQDCGATRDPRPFMGGLSGGGGGV